MIRTEYGRERNVCGCNGCVENCRHMPGHLIPADLVDPLIWSETNLLASPGAKVVRGDEIFRIPTLVSAVKADGSCIHLAGGACQIHQIAPFGCAFFSCTDYDPNLSALGLRDIMIDGQRDGLYTRIWRHLDSKGLRQLPVEKLRVRMAKAMSSASRSIDN